MTVLQSSTGKVTIKDVSLRLANVTTTERNALNSPTNGDMVYNTTTNALNVYINGVWTALQSGAELQGLENLVEDTSPQLGGTLDVNGNNIDMGTNIITDTFVGNWNTAYGWGDHSGAGYLTSVPAQSFASLTGLPTTLAGYGITDGGGGGGAYIGNNNSLSAGNYVAWRPDAPNTSWYVFKDGDQNDRIANGGNFSTQLTFTVPSGGYTDVGTGDFGTSTRMIFKLG